MEKIRGRAGEALYLAMWHRIQEVAEYNAGLLTRWITRRRGGSVYFGSLGFLFFIVAAKMFVKMILFSVWASIVLVTLIPMFIWLVICGAAHIIRIPFTRR